MYSTIHPDFCNLIKCSCMLYCFDYNHCKNKSRSLRRFIKHPTSKLLSLQFIGTKALKTTLYFARIFSCVF